MEETIQRIDRASEKALASLVGRNIQTLMSESADVAVGHALIEVMSVSFQLGRKRFLIIESDWGDTPKEWLDYHCLSARTADSPRGIKYNPSPPKDGANYTTDHMSLRLGAEAPVAAVEVMEANQTGELESVTYDAGILITRTDGLKVAIVRADSILGALLIVHVPHEIEQATAEMKVRLRYGD